MPLLSVVTIFKDEEKNLAATLQSLLSQAFTNFECLLVNGNSRDSSLEIIQKHTGSDPRFHVYEEEGTGISNAFNQAILLSKSEHLLFLNGGDLLSSSEALSLLYTLAQQHPNSIVTGRSEYIAENGERTGKLYPPKLYHRSKLEWHCAISHQATLIPQSFFRKNGGYIPSFQIAMDYELWLRAVRIKYAIIATTHVVAYHREGGASAKNINRGRKEQICARLLHLPNWRCSLIKDIIQLWLILTSNWKS